MVAFMVLKVAGIYPPQKADPIPQQGRMDTGPDPSDLCQPTHFSLTTAPEYSFRQVSN